MNKLEIFSAIFITIAAGYWYFNPTVNVEPIIVMVSSCVLLFGSFVKRLSRSQGVGEIPVKALSITIKSGEIRCYKEDVDYGIKLDYELFFSEKSVLKSVTLKYKEPYEFGENQSQRSHIFYVKYVPDDLLKQDIESMIHTLEETKPMPSLPSTIDEKSLLQFTIAGYIPGKRVQDGWEGVTLNNWTLVIEINASETYELPVILTKHVNTLKRPVKWEEVGFINT